MSGALVSIAVLQVLTILAGLLRAKGLATLLGPADFGVVSTMDQVVVTLVTFGGLAMPFTAMKFISRGHSEGAETFERTAAGFLRLLAGLGLLTAGVASVLLLVNPGLFGTDLLPYLPSMRIAVLGIPSAMLLILVVNILAASQRPAAGAVANLVVVLSLAVAAVLGAWWKGISGIYILSVAAALVTTIAGIFYLARELGVRLRDPRASVMADLRGRPEILANASAFYAMMCASTVTMLVVRTSVLSRLGAVPAGYLQAAFSLALTVGAVLLPLSNLYLVPKVNRNIPAAEKHTAANEFASRMLVLLLLGTLPVILFPGILLRLLYSASFVPIAGILWLFVLWQCAFQIMYVYQQLLIGLDDVGFTAVASVVGFGAALLATGPLVGDLGLAGAALALGGGTVLSLAAMLLRLRFRHLGGASAGVLRRMVGIMGVVVAAGLLFAGRIEIGPGVWWPRVAFACIVMVGGWLTLNREERDPRWWLAAALRKPAGERT